MSLIEEVWYKKELLEKLKKEAREWVKQRKEQHDKPQPFQSCVHNYFYYYTYDVYRSL